MLVTLDAAIDDFLATCALREMSAGTIRGYRYDLGRLRRFLARRGVDTVEGVAAADLRAFLSSLAVAPSTRARYRASTRSLFHFLAADAVVPRDPSLAVPTVTRPHYLPRPLSPEQVGAVLAAVEDPTLRDLLTLVAETGLRISEAIRLAVEDVRIGPTPEDSSIRVVGKGRRERVVPLLVAAASWQALGLAVAERTTGPVFRRGPGGEAQPPPPPFTYGEVRAVWRRACARAGVGRLRIHQLRHTFASRLVAAQVPIVTVQKLLGHQSLDTTMRYAAVTDNLVRRDLAAARGRLRLGPAEDAGTRAAAPEP